MAISDRYIAPKPKVTRAAYSVAGVGCVGLAYLGAILPGMPSTVFVICALWCFKRSSPRFENWLLNHRWFGHTLRQWEAHRTISPRIKAIALISMSVCVLISMYFIHSLWVKCIVGLLALVGAAVILTRKSYATSPVSGELDTVRLT